MRKEWKEEEINISINMFKAGYNAKDIGVKLNRSEGSVRNKLRKLNYKYTQLRPHRYGVGEEVNGLRIVDKIRTSAGKEYEVQSVTYPDAPTYKVKEGNLVKGSGDAYACGKRIFEGNSLYSIEWIRPYLVNIEESKKIARYSEKPVLLKCINCSKNKKISPSALIANGSFSCDFCRKNAYYPELFFSAMNEVLNMGFLPQQTLPNTTRRFDFVNYDNKVIVETHGLQHFQRVSHWDYEETLESDEEKRKYCKENNWTLIELDCRVSDFSYIQNSINNNTKLPNITSKETINSMLEIIASNKKYDTLGIIKMYCVDKLSTIEIGRIYNLKDNVIVSILKKNNIVIRGNKIELPENKICSMFGEDGLSVKDISKKLSVKEHQIYNILKKNNIKTKGNKKVLPTKTIIKMYTIDEMTTYSIGSKFGVSSTTIGNILKKEGVTIRKGGVRKGNIPWNKTHILDSC